MDILSGKAPSAFRFHGSWQEFAAIAFPNLLLTIVTLGIYRFWATTREREYLWSKTDFIDERLEWTGRGIELFIGFVLVLFLILLPIAFLQFGIQAMVMQGHVVIAILLGVLAFLMVFYLGGVARFRALRYRLSRTYWRGIRGGSDDPGFKFGLSYMWKSFVGWLPIFLLVPWASISLWNERWNAMSFGPYHFSSNAKWTDLMRRYLLFYLVPFLLVVGAVAAGFSAWMSGSFTDGSENLGAGGAVFIASIFILVVGFYIFVPIAALMYYSKFFRVAVGGLRLHDLEMEFKARSADWILFVLANMAIVFCTLGIGYIFLPYRNWKFFVTHMEAYGEINLDHMTQSQTASPTQGEGLLDAFDVGAI